MSTHEYPSPSQIEHALLRDPVPRDILRLQPEPLTPREQVIGININGSGQRFQSAIWLERVSDGYVSSSSVMDASAPHASVFEAKSSEERKTITVKTHLDLEFNVQDIELGLTTCTPVGSFSTLEVGRILLDPTHEMYDFFTDYYKMAATITNRSKLEDSLESFYDIASATTEHTTKDEAKASYMGEVIVRGFGNLTRTSALQKVTELGIPVIHRGFESRPFDPERIMDSLSQMAEDLKKDPEKKKALGLIGRLNGYFKNMRVSTEPLPHSITSDPSLYFTQSVSRTIDLINNTILHAALADAPHPFSSAELSSLVDFLNENPQNHLLHRFDADIFPAPPKIKKNIEKEAPIKSGVKKPKPARAAAEHVSSHDATDYTGIFANTLKGTKWDVKSQALKEAENGHRIEMKINTPGGVLEVAGEGSTVDLAIQAAYKDALKKISTQ